MRHILLERHYRMLIAESKERADLEWMAALEDQLYQRRRLLQIRIGEMEIERLALEAILCPVKKLKAKGEKRSYTKKELPENIEQVVASMSMFNEVEKQLLKKILEDLETKEGENNNED